MWHYKKQKQKGVFHEGNGQLCLSADESQVEWRAERLRWTQQLGSHSTSLEQLQSSDSVEAGLGRSTETKRKMILWISVQKEEGLYRGEKKTIMKPEDT